MSLLRYSLLDEYNADPEIASKPDFEEQPFFYEDENALNSRLKLARKRLYKRCKGLLEIIDEDSLGVYAEATPLANRISLTHRSVQEFLVKINMKMEGSTRFQDFDVFGAIYQTVVVELALPYSRKMGCDDIGFSGELMEIMTIAGEEPNTEKLVSALWNLERILKHHIPSRGDPFFLVFRKPYRSPRLPTMGGILSVPHSAAFCGFHQYFTSSMRPSFLDEGMDRGSLVLTIFLGFAYRYGGVDGTVGRNKILRWIFQQGCRPNQIALIGVL